MRIFDCFMFWNELDMLEIRLNVLSPYVDYFVLVESRFSHKNLPKPLYYSENKERFSAFSHKIKHIVVDSFNNIPPVSDYSYYHVYYNLQVMVNGDPDSWAREHYQRSCIYRGIEDANPDDIILIGDLDEIPNPQRFGVLLELDQDFYAFEQKWYMYYLNFLTSSLLSGTKAIRRGAIKDAKMIQDLRYGKAIRVIPDGGWHFDAIGGKEQIEAKLNAWLEKGINTSKHNPANYIDQYLKFELNIIDSGLPYQRVAIDNSYPEYILNNVGRYQKYISQATNDTATDDDIKFLRAEIIRLRHAWNQLNMENGELKYFIKQQGLLFPPQIF